MTWLTIQEKKYFLLNNFKVKGLFQRKMEEIDMNVEMKNTVREIGKGLADILSDDNYRDYLDDDVMEDVASLYTKLEKGILKEIGHNKE